MNWYNEEDLLADEYRQNKEDHDFFLHRKYYNEQELTEFLNFEE